MLNSKGGIEADLSVTCISKNKFRIITGSGVREHDKKHILRYLDQDVKFTELQIVILVLEFLDLKVDHYLLKWLEMNLKIIIIESSK